MKRQVPEQAVARLQELQAENEHLEQLTKGDQIGTSIPRIFGADKAVTINSSNIGTGTISRMIETDDTVSSSVQFKIMMILAKMGDYHHENKEIATFINKCLGELKEPTWNQTKAAMLSAKAHGFSVSEIVYGLNDRLEKIPVRIPTYHPSTIAFETDEFGRITQDGIIQFVIQHTQSSNPNNTRAQVNYGWLVKNPFETPTDRLMPYRIPFIQQYGMARIPRRKCIHITNLPELAFGSPYGKTAVRTAHLAWQLKVFFLRQMGIAGKRNASPMVHATAPMNQAMVKMRGPDGTEKEYSPTEALRVLLAARETDDAVITGPETAGYKITAISQQADMSQFIAVINMLDVKIFRCFLLPSLVMTDGSAGSRALGDKHFQIVDRIAESEAQDFGQSVVNDLIEPLIRDNFGPQDDYGKFLTRPQNAEERAALANVFATLGNSGWMSPAVEEDMNYVRSSLGLPENVDLAFGDDDGDEGRGDKVPDAKDGADDEDQPSD